MSELFADRMPPHNQEAERAVLGAILIEPAVLVTVTERLRPEDFYRQSHQRLFQVIIDVSEQGEPIDLVTLTSELSDRKLLEEVGGVSYLTELAEAVPTAANVDYYAQIVEEKAILRRLIRTATEIATSGYSGGDEVTEVIDSAEKKILEISQRRIRKGFTPIREILMETFERIENLHYNQGKLTGVPSGYTDLDRMTSGFQKSDLSIKGLNSNTRSSNLEIFLKGISFFEFLFKFISTPPYKGYNYFHYIYNIKVKVGQ